MFNRDYDYFEAVDADVLEHISENYSTEELKQYFRDNELDNLRAKIYDDCFIDDSVTGNASGSYWCNSWKAEQCLAGNLSLLCDAIEEFGGEASDYRRAIESPETADCFIRLHILSESVSRVFDYVMDEIAQ